MENERKTGAQPPVRLIACDMDGTLLDSRKRLPPELGDVLAALRRQGVLFAVASGRQYAALRRDMQSYERDMLFICENGALVMHSAERLLIDPLEPRDLPVILEAARGLEGVYPVVCRADVALVEESASPAFIQNTRMYYPSVQEVSDLSSFCGADDVCKVAFYDEGDAQTHEMPALQARLGARLPVILSGEHWVDVMKPGVNKGHAMRALQRLFHIDPQACMAFGDYLNDCELLSSVGESYAMANAHPALKALARHIAPSNDEDGVMRVIRERFHIKLFHGQEENA